MLEGRKITKRGVKPQGKVQVVDRWGDLQAAAGFFNGFSFVEQLIGLAELTNDLLWGYDDCVS